MHTVSHHKRFSLLSLSHWSTRQAELYRRAYLYFLDALMFLFWWSSNLSYVLLPLYFLIIKKIRVTDLFANSLHFLPLYQSQRSTFSNFLYGAAPQGVSNFILVHVNMKLWNTVFFNFNKTVYYLAPTYLSTPFQMFALCSSQPK